MTMPTQKMVMARHRALEPVAVSFQQANPTHSKSSDTNISAWAAGH